MKYQKLLYGQNDVNRANSVTKIKNASFSILNLNSKQYNKNVLKDMAEGFKMLIDAMKDDQQDAFPTLINWLEIYLRIHKLVRADNVLINQKYEKSIPKCFTYVVASLFYKPELPCYHKMILKMSLQLINNISESTLKRVAHLEVNNTIAFLYVIDIVGDFQAQLLALQLFSKLLKFFKAEDIFGYLPDTPELHSLGKKIFKLVHSENYDEKYLEKKARTILNSFNMNSENSCQVYSLWCKSLQLGKYKFFKNMSDDQLWVDFNYNSKTMTSSCILRHNKKETQYNISLEVTNLKLSNRRLIVVFKKPVDLSPEFSNEIEIEIPDVCQAILVLDLTEVTRLQKNDILLKYYSSPSESEDNKSANKDKLENNKQQQTTIGSLVGISNFEYTGDSYLNSTSKTNDSPLLRSQVISESSSSTANSKIFSQETVVKRRFFRKSLSERDSDYLQSLSERNRQKQKAKKNLPKTRKQVNKVKPMVKSVNPNGCQKEAVQENIESSDDMDVTNLAENNNTPASKQSESLRILQNIQNIPTNINKATNSSCTVRNNEDIYNESNMSLSEVEPGLSYRCDKAKIEMHQKTVRKSIRKIATKREITTTAEKVSVTRTQIRNGSRKRSGSHLNVRPSTLKKTRQRGTQSQNTFENSDNQQSTEKLNLVVSDESISSKEINECRRNMSAKSIELTTIASPPNRIDYDLEKSLSVSAVQNQKSFGDISDVFSTSENETEQNWQMTEYFDDKLRHQQPFSPPSSSQNVIYRRRSINSEYSSDNSGIERSGHLEPNTVGHITRHSISTEYAGDIWANQRTRQLSLSAIDATAIVRRSSSQHFDMQIGTPESTFNHVRDLPNILIKYQTEMVKKLEEIKSEINSKWDDPLHKIEKIVKRSETIMNEEQIAVKLFVDKVYKLVEEMEELYKIFEERKERFKNLQIETGKQINIILKNSQIEDLNIICNEADDHLQKAHELQRRTIWQDFAKARIDQIQRRLTSFLSL